MVVRRDKVLGSGLVQEMQRQVLCGRSDRDHTICIDEAGLHRSGSGLPVLRKTLWDAIMSLSSTESLSSNASFTLILA